MDEKEFRIKDALRAVLDNEYFTDAIAELKKQIAIEMALSDDLKLRDDLHAEFKAVDRVVGRLNAMANDIRMMAGTPVQEPDNKQEKYYDGR